METIKVRIAVAVDGEGNWVAQGWGWLKDNCDDLDMEELAIDGVDSAGTLAINFIEVDIPIPAFPERETFKGRIVQKE